MGSSAAGNNTTLVGINLEDEDENAIVNADGQLTKPSKYNFKVLKQEYEDGQTETARIDTLKNVASR